MATVEDARRRVHLLELERAAVIERVYQDQKRLRELKRELGALRVQVNAADQEAARALAKTAEA